MGEAGPLAPGRWVLPVLEAQCLASVPSSDTADALGQPKLQST